MTLIFTRPRQVQPAEGSSRSASRGTRAIPAGTPRFLQRKALAVEAATSPLEREADEAAERVMRKPDACCPTCAAGGTCAGKGANARRMPAARLPGAAASMLPSLGAGAPLDHATRGDLEARFGENLGSVRVHADARAARASRILGARAFALAEDIAFGGGLYSPQTDAGRGLIAHEIAHVIQHRSGADGARLRRAGAEDVLNMSIGEDFARSLPEEDLRLAEGLLQAQLMSLPGASIEYEAARSNWDVIRAELAARQLSTTPTEDVRPVSGEVASLPVVFEAEEILGEAGPVSLGLPGQGFGVGPYSSLAPAESTGFETPPGVGPGMVDLGLALHVLASGDVGWLPPPEAAARTLSPEYWSPFVPRPGQVELDRILNDVRTRMGPRIDTELAELAAGQRTSLSWETRGFTQAELRSIPDLIQRYNTGTISPAELDTLRRAAAVHIGGSSPGSPLVSYMEPNFPLESVGERRFRVRIEIPSRSALDVSGPNAFNEFGRLQDITNIEEAEFLLGTDREGRIISVERVRESRPGFLMRHGTKIRWAGRVAFVAGLAFSGHRIATAAPHERAVVIGEEAGGLALGAAGTAAAVAGCVAFGIATGGLGLFVCGLVGGAAGTAIGSALGGAIVREVQEISDAVQWAAEHSPGSFFVPPGTVTLHGARGGFRGMLRTPLDVQREMQAERRSR